MTLKKKKNVLFLFLDWHKKMEAPKVPLICYKNLQPINPKVLVNIPKKSPDPLEKDAPKTFAGKGSYGEVLIMRDRKTKAEVAVKFFRPHPSDQSALPWFALREFVNLHSLQTHPNLVRLLGSDLINDEMFIVMEKGLVDLAHAMGHPNWPGKLELNIQSYMHQLLTGVKYMHDNLVWHLDLKPSNILLFGPRAEQLKITDLGLSLSGPFQWREKPISVISLFWRPPELLMKRLLRQNWHYERSFGNNWPYGPTADAFSVGVIYMGMLQATPYQRTLREKAAVEKELEDISLLRDEELTEIMKQRKEKLLIGLKDIDEILDFWTIDKEEIHVRDVFSVLDIGNSVTAMDWSTLNFKTRQNGYKALSDATVARVKKDRMDDLRDAYLKDVDKTEEGKAELKRIDDEYSKIIKKMQQDWSDMAESNEPTTIDEDNQFVRTTFETLIKRPFIDDEWELFSSLLCCDPRRRITVTQALRFPLFKNFAPGPLIEPKKAETEEIMLKPNLKMWSVSLEYIFYWVKNAKVTYEVYFMASKILLCIASKYSAKKNNLTKDQEQEIYLLSAASSLELCCLFCEGDSVETTILNSIPNLPLDMFHQYVRNNIYLVDARLQQMNAYYFLESILSNPDIIDLNQQHPRIEYIFVLAFIYMTPLYFKLTEKEMAILAIFIVDNIEIQDLNDNEPFLFQERKEELLRYAESNKDKYIVQSIQHILDKK